MEPDLRLDEFPFLCLLHEGVPVERPEAVFVTVRPAGSGLLPVGVLGIDMEGGFDANVLNVPPCQVWSREE
jgi:hypothetical protein